LDEHAVYLIPIGPDRFDLYAEPSAEAEADGEPPADAGFWGRQAHTFHRTWRETSRAAHAARQTDAGRIIRLRDWMVRRIADSITDQQTLWSLRHATVVPFVYPAALLETSAVAHRHRLLIKARRHHGIWLMVHLVAVAITAVLMVLPGPNLIGYYFAFRVIGHFLSWRGARRALDRVSWRPRAEPALSELTRLALVSRTDRAAELDRIAAHLQLPHLHGFFDRAAEAGR
jgi:hypothetical protein